MKLRNWHLLRVNRTSVYKAVSASRMCTRFRSSSRSDERILWPRVAPRPTRPPAPLVAKRRPLLARPVMGKNFLSLFLFFYSREKRNTIDKRRNCFFSLFLSKQGVQQGIWKERRGRGKGIFDKSSTLKSAKERKIRRDWVWRVLVRIKLSFEAQNAFSISIRGSESLLK